MAKRKRKAQTEDEEILNPETEEQVTEESEVATPEETTQEFLDEPVESAKPQRATGKKGYQEQALPYSEKHHTPARPVKHALPETQDQKRERQRNTEPEEDEVIDKADKEKDGDDSRIGDYVGKYWRSTTHITGYGTVNGKATREQLRVFLGGINPESDLDDWLSDKDEYNAYVKKHTKKRPTQEQE